MFLPNNHGGGLQNLEDIDDMFRAGADKVTLNTMCFKNPGEVIKAVSRYGSQAITASLDVKNSRLLSLDRKWKNGDGEEHK